MQSLEYRIRSLFLKIDQRDYLFSKILNFIYKFLILINILIVLEIEILN